MTDSFQLCIVLSTYASVDGSTEVSDSSVRSCVRSLLECFLLVKDMIFTHCSYGLGSFLGLPSLLHSTCQVSSHFLRMHYTPCEDISSFQLFGNHFVGAETLFYAFKTVIITAHNYIFLLTQLN